MYKQKDSYNAVFKSLIFTVLNTLFVSSIEKYLVFFIHLGSDRLPFPLTCGDFPISCFNSWSVGYR